MSFSPPPSVPTINSIAASPTSPDRPLQSPGASQPPGNNITSPAPLSRSSTLLLTPPISEPQSKQDRGGYFSLRKAPSSSRNTRTASPCLSPGLSCGGSFNSSDTAHSYCSYSSGEFLSPPHFQGDDDKPPYIPRRSSSESLSMVKKKLRRAETIANDKKIKIKRRHRKHHGCRHRKSKSHEQHAVASWGESSCQVAPTAPMGEKELCRGHSGDFAPRSTPHGNTDTFGRLMPHAMPGSAAPLVARRWSSVEAGAHQVVLESMLSRPLPKAASIRGFSNGDGEDKFVSKNLHNRFRSSSFTRGAVDHDILQAVRERLTVRKVATTQLEDPVEPPLSITLRRASGASALSGVSGLTRSSADRSYAAEAPEVKTPLANAQTDTHDKQPSAAYLITNEDIESISRLIAKNLGQNLQSYIIPDDTSSRRQSSRGTKTSTISSVDAGQPKPLPAESTINVTDFQPKSAHASSRGDYLRVNDLDRPIQRSDSNRSVHEVLWDSSRKSTTSLGSSAFEEDQKHHDSPSESEASPGFLSKDHKRETVVDKGDAFDPDNARQSISEWSWRLPQNEITMVVTSSDSDSADITPNTERPERKSQLPPRSAAANHRERITTRNRHFTRYAASHEQLQDVVSFPPLAQRKATSEWFSPLPEMETTSSRSKSSLKASRSLYDLGVDVTTGPTRSTAFKPPITSWVRSAASAEVSPSQSPGIGLRPDYGFGGLSGLSTEQFQTHDQRRKSVVKPHPKATARTGESFAMGSSIGAHTSERRRSSAPRIKRVRTIDNVHKGKREEPPSRWRPPSICPPRLSVSQQSSSPGEPEEPKERQPEERIPEMMTRLHRLRSGITDRISLVEARCPPLPKSDCVGIYGAITGTLRRSIAAPSGDDRLSHGCDDCANDPRSPSFDWIG